MSDKLDSVHSLAVQVANIDQAVAWYTSSFNCNVIQKEITRAELEFENTKLVLTLPSQEPRYVAFGKDNAESYGTLKDRGDGHPSTYLSDPTGNIVKLIKTN